MGQRIADRGCCEQHRCEYQQPLAAQAIAERSGCQCPNETANQSATVGPTSERFRVQVEIALKEGFRPTDHDPVVTEQKATESGDERNHPEIPQIELSLRCGGL